jgi:ribosomal-protein-alanine acetyltransferase
MKLETQPHLRVRSATVADISRMLELERQNPRAAHWTEEQYRRALESESGGPARMALLIEESGGRVSENPDHENGLLGFLIASQLGAEWELENIVVAAAARRRGVGLQLLHELFTRARNQGVEQVFLEVRESNVDARNLYKKMGFCETSRRKSYYINPPEDSVLYRRDLI